MSKKPYHTYTKEELLKEPRIKLSVMEDESMIFRCMADEMIEIIQQNNSIGNPTVLVVPVGPTGQYPYFTDRVNQERISLKNVWFINMDEYLTKEDRWIPIDHPLSFRGFMEREVHGKIDEELRIPEEQRIFPDPERIDQVGSVIKALGKIDAVFGGVGINGHVAFNEPDPSLSVERYKTLQTRVAAISLETLVVNSLAVMDGAYYEMPSRCVTIGFQEMLRADRIRLGVFRAWHRSVVWRAAHDQPTTHFPITIFAEHKDILIRMPESVATI